MPRLSALALLCLVLAACGGTATPDPYGMVGAGNAYIAQTEIAQTRAPETQTANDKLFDQHRTETAEPASLTSTAVANLAALATLEAGKTQSARDALAYQTSVSLTLEALTLLQSDTQKRISQNNAAIANTGIVADSTQGLCFGAVGVLIFGLLVFACVTLRQYQLWLDTKRRIKDNRAWRQLANDYRPRIAAPMGYRPEPPRNLSAESKLRAACKVYVDACVTLAQGGVKHPFSRPTALTYGLVLHPSTGEVWQSGHDVIIRTLTGAGVLANTGKGGRTEFAAGWDYERFKREFDLTPLPPAPEGPIPAAKIVLAGSQVTPVFAGSQV